MRQVEGILDLAEMSVTRVGPFTLSQLLYILYHFIEILHRLPEYEMITIY